MRETHRRSGINAEVAPFFHDLPARLGRAHLVIARAGASTVSELCVARPAGDPRALRRRRRRPPELQRPRPRRCRRRLGDAGARFHARRARVAARRRCSPRPRRSSPRRQPRAISACPMRPRALPISCLPAPTPTILGRVPHEGASDRYRPAAFRRYRRHRHERHCRDPAQSRLRRARQRRRGRRQCAPPAIARHPGRGRSSPGKSRRCACRRHFLGGEARQSRSESRACPAAAGGAPRRDARRADAPQMGDRGCRHAWQDHDDVDDRRAARDGGPRSDDHQWRHHQRARHQRPSRQRRLDGGRSR